MLYQTGEMEEMKKCKKINMETVIEVGLILLGTDNDVTNDIYYIKDDKLALYYGKTITNPHRTLYKHMRVLVYVKIPYITLQVYCNTTNEHHRPLNTT